MTAQECPDEGQFALLLQGELAGEPRQRLEDHLDDCPMCAQLMVELAQVFFPDEGDEAPEARLDVIEHYELRGVLGAGGMGAVYRAFDKELEREVALKLLRADLIEPELREAYSQRMLREAKVLAALNHPHVLTVHDVGRWRDQVFIVTELIEGETLRQWLEADELARSRGQGSSWRARLDIFLDAAKGLQAAHDAGLVHRDVKLENLMYSSQGRVVVMDFGLARVARGDDEGASTTTGAPTARLGEVGLASTAATPKRPGMALTLTQSGVIMGTPAYMSPEQHVGGAVDARTDQFSWCVATFEALYGMRPFAGSSVSELMLAVCGGKVRPRPEEAEVPAAVYEVLCQGLAPSPAERFGSMRELVQAMEEAAQAQAIASVAPVEDDGGGSSKRWMFGVAAAVVLLVGGFGASKVVSPAQQNVVEPPVVVSAPAPVRAIAPEVKDDEAAEALKEARALSLRVAQESAQLRAQDVGRSLVSRAQDVGVSPYQEDSGRAPQTPDEGTSPPMRRKRPARTNKPFVQPVHQETYEQVLKVQEQSGLAAAAWEAAQEAKAQDRWGDCVKYAEQSASYPYAAKSYRVMGLTVRAECLFPLKRCDEAIKLLREYEVQTKRPGVMEFWAQQQRQKFCPDPSAP